MSGRYESAGVDYDVLDAAKRTALLAVRDTMSARPPRDGFGPEPRSQGEPAFVYRAGGLTLASVLECLGTKSVLAREYAEAGGPDLFRNVGIDGVAAIVNDLACVGAVPLVVHAYFATGAASWYEDEERFARLVDGWREGCDRAGAVWGGGESPTLGGLVAERDIEIAGSAVGYVPGEPVLGDRLAPGDEIVLVASTGLHTNGASLVRSLGPDALRAVLPSGRELGAAVLDPSAIYTSLVAAIPNATYYSNITGHGLRKVMRADRELTYRIDALPPVPEVLAELQRLARMSDRDAYGTLNMGAGFAVFCRRGEGAGVVQIAAGLGLVAVVAGEVQEGPRRVILEPVGVVFEQDELRLRADR